VSRDIKLADLIKDHLTGQGWEIYAEQGDTITTHPKGQDTNRWWFKCDGRILTVSPEDNLIIIKVDGRPQSSETLDMADPDALKNLDNLITVIIEAHQNKK
jgi:hypothetical protein